MKYFRYLLENNANVAFHRKEQFVTSLRNKLNLFLKFITKNENIYSDRIYASKSIKIQ